MTDIQKNIHPIFDQLLQRKDKEQLLEQRSKVIWLTGLSGSGKSTIAKGAERILHEKGRSRPGEGFLVQLLDGDNIRTGINKNLGFSQQDRLENIRRIAEVSKLFLNCGVLTINSFVSPTIRIRANARKIIGAADFIEVYINCPLSVCEQRDVKGLYKKARAGEIEDFTGIDDIFEAPKQPDLEIRTDELSVEESVEKLVNFVLPGITI